jgi:MFS transporter, DHA1 family, multidrug resistance protein
VLPFKIENKGVFFIAVSQFGVAFSFQCILAFIPFYILKISAFGPRETMIWTGMIMGASNAVASFTASFWGGLTSRFRPKVLFEWGMILNGILILLMGFANSLYLLLLLRIMQGLMGGVSTTGLILTSSLSSRERLHKDISLFQNSMTAGQLMGPPVGAFAASLFGYQAPFFFAFLVTAISTLFCHRYVGEVAVQERASHPETPLHKGLLLGWALCLISTIHITFLPSILPTILKGFQLAEDTALRSAGFIIMLYTATAILGNHLLSRTASKFGLLRAITTACLIAAGFQIALILSRDLISFSVLRMLQMGFIAGIIPLIFTIFAREVSGRRIGFLNSSRFVGAAVGPLMATAVLAYSGLFTLYLLIAGLTLATLWAFMTSVKKMKNNPIPSIPISKQ